MPEMTDATGDPTGPLAGIRVVDLTGVLFGPLATRILGDWGADVVKVESLSGDLWRNIGAARHPGMSGPFMAVNRNKRSVAVDLKHPDGKTVLERLIRSADVVVSNIRPEGMARLGFDAERCRSLNPDIIHVTATGFGQDGPWRARPAFDEIVQAASGFASALGSTEEPALVPSLLADKICGLELAGAIAAALVHRERTGEGQSVEVPMLETVAAFNSIEMLGGHAFEPPIGPTGYHRLRSRRPARTADGWLAMLPYTGAHWAALFEAIGHPEWVDEISVHDPVERGRRLGELYDRIHEITPTRTTAEWIELLLRLDIPVAEFAEVDRIADQEHLEQVGLFRTMEHPTEGAIVQARPATRFSASPPSIRRMPPGLGEHTREVLAEAGFIGDEIDRLLAAGVVAEPHTDAAG